MMNDNTSHYLYKFAQYRELKANKKEVIPDLLTFMVDTHKKMYNETFIVKPFHEEVCDLLTRFARREIKDKYILILNMPFRYSKTQMLIYYIIWCFLQNEMARFIYTTYAEKLSLRTSREVKKALMDIFHKRSSFSKDAAQLWETNSGGGLWSTTMQGSVIGYGAGDIYASPFSGDLIIDDPISAANCFYETKRNTCNESLVNTFWSRRNQLDKIPMIINMQRLHPKDPCWFIMDKYPNSYIRYVIKGINEEGDSSFPERVSTNTLLDLKQATPYTFYSQVQQEPQAYSGNFFIIDRTQIISVKEYRERETRIKYLVRSWDLAGVKRETRPKENEDRDYTRGVLMGTDGEFVYISDMKSHKGTVDYNEILIGNTAKTDGWRTTITVPEDPGPGGQHLVDYLQKTPALNGFTLTPIRPVLNKQLRAAPFASFLNLGKVIIVSDEEDNEKWNQTLLEEMASFPFGSHDDCIDACSDCFYMIHSVHNYI